MLLLTWGDTGHPCRGLGVPSYSEWKARCLKSPGNDLLVVPRFPLLLTWGALDSASTQGQGTATPDTCTTHSTVEIIPYTDFAAAGVGAVDEGAEVEEVIMTLDVPPHAVPPVRGALKPPAPHISGPEPEDTRAVADADTSATGSADEGGRDTGEEQGACSSGSSSSADEPSTHSQMDKLFEQRRHNLHKEAEKQATREHVHRQRRKRSLQQAIDECLVDDVDMHRKATGLRLAFQSETEMWQAKINEASKALATGIAASSTINSSSRGNGRSNGEEVARVDAQEITSFIYSFDEDGIPYDPLDLLHTAHAESTYPMHRAHALRVAVSADQQVSEPAPAPAPAPQVTPDVQAAKRSRRFVSPLKVRSEPFI